MKTPLEKLDKEVKEAERNLRILKDKQYAQRCEIPPLEKKAKELVGYGYSDALIQSKLYASRTSNIGINEIVEAIAKARRECNAVVN